MPDEQHSRRSVSRRDVMRGAAVLGGAAATVGLVAPGSASAAPASTAAAPASAAAAPGSAAAAPGSAAAAPDPAPGQPARSRFAGLDDWLGSLVQVATVAANVLPMLVLVQRGETSDPYQLGGVQFEVINIDGEPSLYAHNISGDDVGLSYTLTQSAPASNTSVYQPLPKGGAYKCEPDLKLFTDGQVFLAPNPTSTASTGTLARTLSFAVRGLTIGAVVQVVGGVKLSVTKDPAAGSFTAVIEATGTPKTLRAEVEATGPDGNMVRAVWDSSGSPNGPSNDTIKIPLPAGVNLDPVVQLLQLYVDLDAPGLDAVTTDRRSRVIYL
ncbi:twin-arginine translocation signal domain-containing protein [Micromonospora yangpuensis]|uniref:Tat (Twin-arginine translocation) pathway signal sequence n=1 Tax=Micromonospora yangpuensis TaxID=683228 RepID=A0A1C6UF81_9ACTN|nr:twin-arginine translocation signal domain-containing protein [Micromonospora yangpuensis]SCL52624.1 Tat (twin-arginine translocation) pathway signal sequence [Micromonospora yangpuensis]